MMKIVVVCALIALAAANPARDAAPDSGIEAIGPAPVKLQYHAPAQYPVQHPIWNPYFGYPGFPAVHPAVAAAAAGYGAPFAFNPYFAGALPAFGQHNPVTAPFTGPNPYAAFPGFLSEDEEITEDADVLAEDDEDNDEDSTEDDEEDVLAEEEPANPFAEAQSNWNNYFAGPTSEYTWPGAPEAAPGVHPNLGGRLNPFNPLGAPSHPYPFPMHQGVKNGPRHPRPFTSTGEYYPGQSEIPPQFFPNPFGVFGNPLAAGAPVFPGFGFQAPYFPAAKNGKMN